MTHTPEPWEAEGALVEAFGKDRECLMQAGIITHTGNGNANAARIVACVNGCAGLNPAAYRECVEALKSLVHNLAVGAPSVSTKEPSYKAACEALAHATEQP